MRNPVADTRGTALVVALMAMLLLGTLSLALVLNTTIDGMVAGHFRGAQEALYAADAGVERIMDDLRANPRWSDILAGGARSNFVDGPPGGRRTLADGSTIDLLTATNALNCGRPAPCTIGEMNAPTQDRPWAANNPRWQLFAYGHVNDLVPASSVNSNLYVIAWIADDPSETDDDPGRDGEGEANPGTGVMVAHVEALGPGGIRKSLEVTVARAVRMRPSGEAEAAPGAEGEAPAGVRIIAWRQVSP